MTVTAAQFKEKHIGTLYIPVEKAASGEQNEETSNNIENAKTYKDEISAYESKKMVLEHCGNRVLHLKSGTEESVKVYSQEGHDPQEEIKIVNSTKAV